MSCLIVQWQAVATPVHPQRKEATVPLFAFYDASPLELLESLGAAVVLTMVFIGVRNLRWRLMRRRSTPSGDTQQHRG